MVIDYTTLRFVDKVGDNLLFRGGTPVYRPPRSPWYFDYSGLQETMQFWVRQWPQSYYLVVVSLLDDTGDEQEVNIESQFFASNPDLGQLIWWPIAGTPACYFETDLADRDNLVRTLDDWMPDKIIERAGALRYYLETGDLPTPGPSGVPYVFYVHCDGGCDRTGEMIATYRLRHQGWSWLSAWSEQPCLQRPFPGPGDGPALPQPMGCNNYRAAQWYAKWLKLELGFNLTDIGNDGGCADTGLGVHQGCPCSGSKRLQQG